MITKDLEEITIVIPTRDRYVYLKRALAYYDSFGLKINIVVADSSVGEQKIKTRLFVNGLKFLKVHLLNDFEYDTPPYFKCLEALKTVQTKYCVFGADDDFISLEGVKKAFGYLEVHQEYIAVEGQNVFFRQWKVFGYRFFLWKPGDVYLSLDSIDARKRLIKHAQHYQPTFYALAKTKFFIHLFEQALKTKSIDYPFGEFQPSFLTAIHGKVKRLKVFYGARDHTAEFSSSTPPENLIQKYKDEGSFLQKYKNFKKALVSGLMLGSSTTKKEAEGLVDQFLLAFLKKQQTKRFIKIMQKLFVKTLFYPFFVTLYMWLRWLKFDFKRYFFLRKMLKQSNEFKRIKHFVLKRI